MSAYELTKTILKDSANLKAYYRFESGALTTDSSGNSKTLTNNGTVTDGTGVYGGAADLGTSGSKNLSIADSLGIDGGACSMSCWVKLNSEISAGTYGFMSTSNNTSKTNFNIQYNYNAGTRQLSFNRIKAGVAVNAATYTITLGTSSWYHLCLTYDATSVRGFVNGIYIGLIASSGNGVNTTNNKSAIGISADGVVEDTDCFALIDDAAFFNTALSADQIKELYEGRHIGEWLPQANLVGLWHLNGNSTDSSGNHNHGTDASVTYSLANGKIAQGGDFDGTNSKITIADSSSIQVGQSSAFTLMAWVQTDVNNTQKYIINKQSATANMFTYNLSMSSGGKPVFGVSKQGVAANDATGNTTLSTGVWHHLTGVSDGSNLTIYLNGASDGTSTISFTSATTNTSSLYFGQLYNDTLRWNGRIDEVAIFSRALTAAEIRHWYAWSKGMYV